ncbi:MAG TPA: CAP domain-containing protein [Solirubrobacteraceae bacterium]|nr:CAP domain-containing protein [Solirubrobacteraceae bacterium]
MRFRRAAAVAVGLTTLGTTTPASARAESPTHDAVERSVVRKLNWIRAHSGIRKLRASRGLARAADVQSSTIASTGVFAHGDVRGRVARFVRAREFGETLAWVPPSQASDVGAVVRTWMASGAHRDALLSGRFARIGVARRAGRIGGAAAVVFTVDLASAR